MDLSILEGISLGGCLNVKISEGYSQGIMGLVL